MRVQFHNETKGSKRLMIVSTNQRLITKPNEGSDAALPYSIDIGHFMDRFKIYDYTQPPQCRKWASLKESTDYSLSWMGCDGFIRAAVKDYDPKTNNNPKYAADIIALAECIKLEPKLNDATFLGEENYDESANFVVDYKLNRDGNPDFKVFTWVSEHGFFDSYSPCAGGYVMPVAAGKKLELNNVQAVILVNDKTETLYTQENNLNVSDEDWSAAINEAITAMGAGTLYATFAEYTQST